MFNHILGNDPVKRYLQRALEQNTLPNTLLFSGPHGVGKSLFAKALARKLLNAEGSRIEKQTHPDFHPLFPEGKSALYSIETLRAMIHEVHSAPFEAPKKVFVLHDAERMLATSSNAILKTLEEPNLDTTIILMTSYPRQILPTIYSRCTKVPFQPLKTEEIEKILSQMGHSTHFSKFSEGSVEKALKAVNKTSLEEKVLEIFSPTLSEVEVLLQMEALEKSLNEDPVEKSMEIEQIFHLIFSFARDELVKRLNLPQKALFPDYDTSSFHFPDLERLEVAIEEMRTCFSRNIKFTVFFYHFYQTFIT